jgi:3-dehydroquinate synthase
MREVTVPLPGADYPILIGPGLLDTLGERARLAGLSGRAALIQDEGVATLYGGRAHESLERAGFAVATSTVPAGEGSKSLDQLGRLYEFLARAGLDRGSAVFALGGGVVGDLAGFAAASYMRGVPFVQVPTTLLAQVDASVGGKTGIDLPEGKNLVGAFHQPRLVLADLDTLRSLPGAEFRAGMAEVIKYGVIWDVDLLGHLEANADTDLPHSSWGGLEYLIARSCEIKAAVVGKDEKESGLRGILNYGHTVGHAIETVAGYGTYLHGEAVAIGMIAAGELAVRRGWLGASDAARIAAIIEAYGLPTRLRAPLSGGKLAEAMYRDKKTQGGRLRFVLARAIGRVELTPVDEAEVLAVLPCIGAS